MAPLPDLGEAARPEAWPAHAPGVAPRAAPGIRSRATTPPPSLHRTDARSAVARGQTASKAAAQSRAVCCREADVYGLLLVQLLPSLLAGVLTVWSPKVHRLLVGPESKVSPTFWVATAGGAVVVLLWLRAFRATYPLNAVLAVALSFPVAAISAALCALWLDRGDPGLGAAGLLIGTISLVCSTLAALADRAFTQQPTRLALLFSLLLCHDLDDVQLQAVAFIAVAFHFLVEHAALHRSLVPPSEEHLVHWAYMSFYSLVLALTVCIKLQLPLWDAAFCGGMSAGVTLGIAALAHRAARMSGDGRLADALRVYAL